MFNKIEEINLSLSDCSHLSKTAYLYVEPQTKKEFVLKVEQKEDWDIASTNILEQEFRKLIHLSNEPEIASVNYLVKVDGNKIGYLMEFVRGQSLKELLSQNEFIEYEVAVNITKEILFALEKAHHLGIFHQDLHNRNIMINDLGYVKLIDFLDMNSIGMNDDYQQDIKDLQNICKDFFLKIAPIEDQRRYLAISNFIFSLKILNGASKEINKIIDTIDELMYFDSYVFRMFYIFGKAVQKAPLNGALSYKTSNRTIPFSSLKIEESGDTFTTNSIQSQLKKLYKGKLFSFISLNFMLEPLVEVTNVSSTEFTYNVMFLLTPKFFKYKNIVDKHQLLDIYISEKDIQRDIHDLIFVDLESFLYEEKLLEKALIKQYYTK